MYHLEAYKRDYAAHGDTQLAIEVSADFIPVDVQRTVAAAYQLDRSLTDYALESKKIVQDVILLVGENKRGLVRAQTLLSTLLFDKKQFEAALYVLQDPQCIENAHAQN